MLLRLAVLCAMGLVQQRAGGLLGAAYLLLPGIAAVLISRRGEDAGFRDEDATWLSAVLDWIVAFYGYLLFVTDRFPLGAGDRAVRLVVLRGGRPTVGTAMKRLVTTLPHAIVLAVLGVASSLVAAVAALLVLLAGRFPSTLYGFQRDVLAWMARVLAYHASLVESYPPFSLGETGSSSTEQHHAPSA